MDHDPLVLTVGEQWESNPMSEMASAGYLWHIQPLLPWAEITVVRESTPAISEAEAMVGSSNTVHLRVRALAEGQGKIVAECKRPWLETDDTTAHYERLLTVVARQAQP